MTTRVLADESATTQLGADLARTFLRAGGGVLYLRGDLGTGKTTLARGLLRAAGHTGTLRSPTYTLLEPYAIGPQAFLHLDLYRLADPSEVEELGLRDHSPESTIWLVEWPERGEGYLPPADVVVHLHHRGLERVAEIHCLSDRHTINMK
ncbi:MAG: tRNA (adenosine(37)-N6)-threonylcarbamoyltransferase complex ATPase subunit type 1 TsaE [Panacagrimonas sp.]